jgi:hypothetical protein
VSVAIRKLDGVESVDVSLEKASADIRLKSDNKITLPQIRQTIKNSGYPTRDARIEARGRIVERGGKAWLDLLNGSSIELAARPAAAAGTALDVSGVSTSRGRNGELLTVTSIK